MEDYEIKIEIEWQCTCGNLGGLNSMEKNKFKSKRCPNRKCKSPYWQTAKKIKEK